MIAPKKFRLFSLDLMRAMAILLVILTHSQEYLLNKGIVPYFGDNLSLLGLSLFFFLSGYATHYTHSSINSWKGIYEFYKGRALRIYPLYWCALCAFIVPGFIDPKLSLHQSSLGILSHFLGLQILLYPYIQPIFTLWFVGAIVLFYIIYPFLIKFAKSVSHLLILSLLIFMGLVAIHGIFGIIECSFFLYYYTFIIGISFSYLRLFYEDKPTRHLFLMSAIFLLILIQKNYGMDIIYSIFAPYINAPMLSRFIVYISGGINCMFGVVFSIIVFQFGASFKDSFNHNAKRLISSIAVSSYCVFLIHRPALTGLQLILDSFKIYAPIHDLFVYFMVLIIFTISYYMQTIYDRIILIYQHRTKRQFLIMMI